MINVPARIFVLPVNGRETEVAELRELITRAGCEVTCAQAHPADYEKCLNESDVLVILICPETKDSPTVDSLIVKASQGGKRVVGIWMPSAGGLTLPNTIHAHGDAVVTFDIDAIRQSVCGGNPTWEMPDGKPRPAPKTPRHKG